MSRKFRIKYMKFMAVLVAAAVIVGNLGTSLLYVQAASEYESDEGEAGGPDEEENSSASSNDVDILDDGNDRNNTDDGDEADNGPESDVIVYEDDGTVEEAVIGEEEDDGKIIVTISGIKIEDKKYDGKPAAYSGTAEVRTVPSKQQEEDEKEEEETPEESDDTETQTGEDVTDKVTIAYRVEQKVVKDGKEVWIEYPVKEEDSEEAADTEESAKEKEPEDEGNTDEPPMPIDAGSYRLVVYVSEEDVAYKGSKEFPFEITKRKITVKPVDVALLVGDPLPDSYEYEVAEADGEEPFVQEDGFAADPVFTCADIENTDEPGTYDIKVKEEVGAGDNYDIAYEAGTLTVSWPKAKFIRVRSKAQEAVRNVANGTLLENIVLPKTVEIVIENVTAKEEDPEEITVPAAVEWELTPIDETAYNPSVLTEQTFKLGGTVILPDNAVLPEDAEEDALYVTIEVYVLEALISNIAVAAPTANPASGSYLQVGTRVMLSCETEGAVIYYTLDQTMPTKQSNRYNTPIVINEGTAVIKAFAAKTGYPDSATATFIYFLSSGSSSDDEDKEDDNLNGDVSDEDMEDLPDGVIPPGLWSPEIKDEIVYTGKPHKPAVRLYDHTKLLTENKDYTVSYKNNVNAADKSAEKAPTITITGKGNYSGTLIKTFTIVPIDINDTSVIIDDVTVAYKNKAQSPSPAVYWNNKKLTKNKDYTVQDISCTEVGSYEVTVTGRGNYAGERTFTFRITDAIPVSKLTVGKIANQTYTGAAITPELTVKYKSNTLLLDQDYAVTYENNREVGTASAIIRGIGAYAGTKRVTFKIKAVANLSKAKVALQFNSRPTYTGEAIMPDRVNVTVNLKNENGQTVATTLVEDRDYELSCLKNDKAGTATAVIKGIGAYGGTIRKTYKIAAYDMQGSKIKITLGAKYPYMKGGSKQEPVVYFNDTVLSKGTDYTLSYKKNNAAGKTAVVTVKGKGNFKGSRSGTYTVTPQDINEVTVNVSDKTYRDKKNIYKTTVRLTDTNGKALKAGTDYDKSIEYTYANNTNVKIKNADSEDIVSRKQGEDVQKDDIIPAGTEITVTINAKGRNYTGTRSETYRIVNASISGARVVIPEQTYTGEEIEPASEIQVVLNGVILTGDDYKIVGYSNNVNKGTAKVILRGVGNYGGTKTASFKITGKGLFSL